MPAARRPAPAHQPLVQAAGVSVVHRPRRQDLQGAPQIHTCRPPVGSLPLAARGARCPRAMHSRQRTADVGQGVCGPQELPGARLFRPPQSRAPGWTSHPEASVLDLQVPFVPRRWQASAPDTPQIPHCFPPPRARVKGAKAPARPAEPATRKRKLAPSAWAHGARTCQRAGLPVHQHAWHACSGWSDRQGRPAHRRHAAHVHCLAA